VGVSRNPCTTNRCSKRRSIARCRDRLDTHEAATGSRRKHAVLPGYWPGEGVAARRAAPLPGEDLTGLLEPHRRSVWKTGVRLRGWTAVFAATSWNWTGRRAHRRAAGAVRRRLELDAAASEFQARYGGWNNNRYLNVTTSGHSACSYRHARPRSPPSGDHPGVAGCSRACSVFVLLLTTTSADRCSSAPRSGLVPENREGTFR